MRGRKRLAQEVHQSKGTYNINPGRENKEAPQPKKGEPAMPETVASIPYAAAKWREICDVLSELNILATCDVDLLEAYAITYGMYRQALNNVVRYGQVIDEGLDAKRSPYSVELHKYTDRMLKLLPEFGLTPASRSRISVPTPEKESNFSELLARIARG